MSVGPVKTGISTRLDPKSQPQTAARSGQAATVGEQVTQRLFVRRRPKQIDPAEHPELAAMLRLLNRWRKKLAVMAGDNEEDYRVVLAEGALAAIDEEGTIYVGANLILGHLAEPEVLAGAIAHEVGHRPKRWKGYGMRRELSQQQLEALCRHEETRADIFCGKALAELGLSCEPAVAYLLRVQTRPHPEYFPASVRAMVIRDAHAGRAFRRENRRKHFPAFDRMTSAKGHIGDY